MVGNVTATSHMKHMDIGYKYSNQYEEDETVKIMHLKSAAGNSNILIKNLDCKLHVKHSSKMIDEQLE